MTDVQTYDMSAPVVTAPATVAREATITAPPLKYTSVEDICLKHAPTAAGVAIEPQTLKDSALESSPDSNGASFLAGSAVSMRSIVVGHAGAAGSVTIRERQLSTPGTSSPGQTLQATGCASEHPGILWHGMPDDGRATICGDVDPSRTMLPRSRLAGATPSSCGTTPVRRRRSSWAAGFCPALLTGAPAGGLEALSPQDLYRQFELIRDAVLNKVACKGQSAQAPLDKGSKDQGGEAGAEEHQTSNALPRQPAEQQAMERSLQDADSQRVPEFDPDAFESVVPSGLHSIGQANRAVEQPWSLCPAREMGVGRQSPGEEHGTAHAAYNSTDVGKAEQPGRSTRGASSHGLSRLGVQIPGDGVGREQQQQQGDPSSPGAMVDLQQYYRSPAASSGGSEQQCSPFEGAVNYASDVVAYNALYGGASARSPPAAAAGSKSAGGSGAQPDERPMFPPALLSGFKLEVCTSIPRTDSLFSLQPSCEPQASVVPMHSQASSNPQATTCCSTAGGATAQMLVFQEDMGGPAGNRNATRAGEQRLGPTSRPEHPPDKAPDAASACGKATMPRTPPHDQVVADSGFGFSVGTDPDGQGTHEEVSSSDVLVRNQEPGGGDGGSFTPDYLKAVQSAATRTLLPLQRLQPGDSGVREAGGAGLERRGARSTGALITPAGGAAGTAAGGPRPPLPQRVGSEGTRVRPVPYVPLPLPPIPSGALSQPSAVPLASLRKSISVAASTTATVRKCLDKGIPFAVMLAEDFAAVVTAAELQDAPLAYHIMSTKCTFYPGLGRPAASSGSSSPTCSNGSPTATPAASSAAVAGLKGNSGGFASAILAKRATTAAAETAAAAVQQLLAEERPLHVMSPCEYQRVTTAAQCGVRQLHDILVAEPADPAMDEATAPAAQFKDRETAPAAPTDNSRHAALPPLSGSVVKRHRRGGSIGSEISFRTNVVRFQSSGDALADSAAAAARMAISASPSPSSTPLQAGQRVRALLEAAQLGNISRVAYLVERFVDVNATDSPQLPLQQPQQPVTSGLRGARAGTFAGSGSLGVGGRTALHYAAEAGSFGVVQLLLHQGAFVGVRDGTGRTAQELARRKGHLAVAQLLKVAADKRRDVVRSCTAESRGLPPTPRTAAQAPKQLRSNSAPASNATNATAAAAVPAAPGDEGGESTLSDGTPPMTVILNAGPAPVQAADSRQTISSMHAVQDEIRSVRKSPLLVSAGPSGAVPAPISSQLDAVPAASAAALAWAAIPEMTPAAAQSMTPRPGAMDGRMDSLLAHDTLPASANHGARRKSAGADAGGAGRKRKGRQGSLLACFVCGN